MEGDKYTLIISFLEELIYICKNNIKAKISLSESIEEFIKILGTTYIDEIRIYCFKLILILLEEKEYNSRQCLLKLSKEIYENLFTFDKYYENIKNITFPSKIIKLDKIDAENLTKGNFTNEDLKAEIEKEIMELGGKCFFKMRRSPKDTYCKINIEENNNKPLVINNVNDITNLCKNSQRIKEDVFDFIDNYDENIIILREYKEILAEFRCFYCNNKVNAISCDENNKYIKISKEDIIIYFGSDEFQSAFEFVPYRHAVLDISVNENCNNINIIEINPFGKMSSSAKFSWVLDRDILLNGYKIYEKITIR